jgi:preprotein translocase subunit SecA
MSTARFRNMMVRAQRRKERQHYKDRMLLMHYEKQRAEMRKNMGLNPVLG